MGDQGCSERWSNPKGGGTPRAVATVARARRSSRAGGWRPRWGRPRGASRRHTRAPNGGHDRRFCPTQLPVPVRTWHHHGRPVVCSEFVKGPDGVHHHLREVNWEGIHGAVAVSGLGNLPWLNLGKHCHAQLIGHDNVALTRPWTTGCSTSRSRMRVRARGSKTRRVLKPSKRLPPRGADLTSARTPVRIASSSDLARRPRTTSTPPRSSVSLRSAVGLSASKVEIGTEAIIATTVGPGIPRQPPLGDRGHCVLCSTGAADRIVVGQRRHPSERLPQHGELGGITWSWTPSTNVVTSTEPPSKSDTGSATARRSAG